MPPVTPHRPHPVQLVAQHPELAVDPRWRLADILGEVGRPEAALLTSLSIAPDGSTASPTS